MRVVRARPYGSAMRVMGCLIPVLNVGCLRRVCAAGLSTGLVGADRSTAHSQQV